MTTPDPQKREHLKIAGRIAKAQASADHERRIEEAERSVIEAITQFYAKIKQPVEVRGYNGTCVIRGGIAEWWKVKAALDALNALTTLVKFRPEPFDKRNDP